jgi:hypothetical protein
LPPQQVRYGRKETAKQAEMRQMSHNFIRQQEQREEWTKLRYLDETLVRALTITIIVE